MALFLFGLLAGAAIVGVALGAGGLLASPLMAVAGAPAGSDVHVAVLRFAADGSVPGPGRCCLVGNASGPLGAVLFPLPPTGEIPLEVGLGRAPDPLRPHFVLPNLTVSRRHAVLEGIDALWEIRGLSTSNPVRVNGRVVGEVGVILKHGDRLELGQVSLTFRSDLP